MHVKERLNETTAFNTRLVLQNKTILNITGRNEFFFKKLRRGTEQLLLGNKCCYAVY